MFRMFVLTKRKAGMSMEAFMDYYENKHSKLAASMSPLMRSYRRNYITPVQWELAGGGEAPFDCIAEVCFDSEEDFRKNIESVGSDPEKVAMIAKDEENLFDRSKTCTFIGQMRESKLT